MITGITLDYLERETAKIRRSSQEFVQWADKVYKIGETTSWLHIFRIADHIVGIWIEDVINVGSIAL